MAHTKKKDPSKKKEEAILPAAPEADMAQLMPGAFDLFKPSMEIVKNNLPAFLVLMAIPMVLTMLGPDPTFRPDPNRETGIQDLLGFIGAVLTLVTFPAVVILQLKGAHKEQISGTDAFNDGLKYLLRLIGLAICMIAIFAISILALIVPFFYAVRRYALAPYYLVDRDLGVFEALKVSAEESKDMWGAIYGIIGVSLLIALPSIVPIIGWIATAVGTVLYAAAPGLRYLHIKALRQDKKDVLTPIEKDLIAENKA